MIPKTQWQGVLDAEVPALKKTAAAVILNAQGEAEKLTIQSPSSLPRGLYQVRLSVRASHTHDAIAFNTNLNVNGRAKFPAHTFARVHQPEIRTFQLNHSKGKLKFTLSVRADAKVVSKARTKANLNAGGPTIGDSIEDDELEIELETTLDPAKAIYFLIDKVEIQLLSTSVQVTKVSTDKIRYLPGETLKGTATLKNIGGKGSTGTLELYLEHNVNDRIKVKSIPVKVTKTEIINFEISLPSKEFGYALVAVFVSKDGKDRSEAAEYFNIATQFQRVAIIGGTGLVMRDTVQDEASIKAGLNAARSEYVNACEYFAWAEDDMVAMSPNTSFWSSGQTNYRMNKKTIQRQIRLAHEQGISVITYGKFIMSGFPGWQTVYDYPNDYREQYQYHVGSYEGVNVTTLDKLRDKDVRVYSKSPNIKGNAFQTWWAGPQWITPDAKPRAIRIAAEECARSVEMFGWDMIRWDGHPRGGGHWIQCGRSGKYQAWAARQTQSLVRYFKDIVGHKYPGFGHGYNYLLIEKDKSYEWAVEDFELDELCRNGGLIMNESIGNASAGWTFNQIVRNLQVDGDLCRERGGFYQGISFGSSNPPRDIIIESALWAAAGARPYNSSMSREVRRYCTRYSKYTFDERLRRIAKPEKILKPKSKTHLWWQPFVYETPLEDGERQLVINLLNIPREDTRPPRDGIIEPKYNMPKGTAPLTFTFTLPEGMKATNVNLISPQTLEVETLSLKNNSFTAPSVSSWSVLVVDLTVSNKTPSLSSLYGAPKTLGKKRQHLSEKDTRRPEVVLDPTAEVWEVNKRMTNLAPHWGVKRAREQAKMDALNGESLKKELLNKRPDIKSLTKQWWKGAGIPADLALMKNRPTLDNPSPIRNGRLDIFYARGAMDYRLRMREWLVNTRKLSKFRLHEAKLGGTVHSSPRMWLANGISADQLPQFDLLLYTGIPHAGIGVEQSYAMVDYVKAGGAVFFTGGEFAFGKGGYIHTVLERELLPLEISRMKDTVYSLKPQLISAGPDFGILDVKVDFAAQPSFYVRNEVILKNGVKVFLESNGRPILVGWKFGKGRVACLLLDHRGKSENGTTLFFDWIDWPKLNAAVISWLTPDAGKQIKKTTSKISSKALKKLLATSEDADLGDLDSLEDGEDDQDLFGNETGSGIELKPKELKVRTKLIQQALNSKEQKLNAALTAQLKSVSNMPLNLRMKMIMRLKENSTDNTAEAGKAALKTGTGSLHGNGYALLALANDVDFAKIVSSPPSVQVESPLMKRERLHDLALAISIYQKGDLIQMGKAKLKVLNQKETTVHASFAKTLKGDSAMLETSPCLNGDDTLSRIAWLAYLVRNGEKIYSKAFLSQWLKIDQYSEYCSRTSAYLIDQKSLSKNAAALCQREWRNLSLRFTCIKQLTQDLAEVIVDKQTTLAAEVMTKARFKSEALAAINLLGNLETKKRRPILAMLKTARHPDLVSLSNIDKL